MRTTARLVRGHFCIGLDGKQVQLQTDRIAETAGRVSVKNRRIWMIKLAIEEAPRRNAFSGASLRHHSYTFLLRRPCLSILSSVYAFMDAYRRWIAKLWSNVRRELRWSARLLPQPPCLTFRVVNAVVQNTSGNRPSIGTLALGR